MVKAMFADHAFRDQVRLSAVNSINWGRIMAQTVYYFTAAASLGAPERAVSFTVPTGNFGDIYAGFVARKMGLPIARLVIATNENDILRRVLDSGRYEMKTVTPTISPSMDIQISSNFERLLFDATGRETAAVRAMMASLGQSGAYALNEKTHAAIRSTFDAASASEGETIETMKAVHDASATLLDPHTAVAVSVAQKCGGDNTDTPMVILSTAHPAKFPEAVKNATGAHPALPARAATLMDGREEFTVLEGGQAAVQSHILSCLRLKSS